MKICAIPGDGIGPEVIGAATRVLQTLVPAVEVVEAEAGWGAFERHGTALPAHTLRLAREADAILFGAVASPSHPVAGYRSPIVQLRQELDLYANIRPVRKQEIDNREQAGHNDQAGHDYSLVVVRENTEGLYAGRERLEDNGNTAIAERVITRRASERIARRAFLLASESQKTKDEGRKQAIGEPSSFGFRPSSPRVTIVHKANVLRVSDGLFREVCLAVAREFPQVQVEEMLVDVAAMHLARSPERFDVLVTTNLFGDILSDIACIHGGGLGLATSANLGEQHALFEPVHGAAPDIAGKGVANPLAAIGCVAMLLNHLVPTQPAAATLRRAIAHVIAKGPHPPDMGGTATTTQVTTAILEQIAKP
jgi:homoisocitrate dehydrogenase